ncbi:acyltransferase family protein [Mariniluteicoccus endophyticus]
MSARTVTTETTAAPRQRIHGLDALRGAALLLGIVLHGLLAYVPSFPWLVTDTRTSPVAGVLSMWIHLFRMPLFLFLAGFFARMSVGRRGTASFVKDRLKRIGLPFVVFAPLMLIALIAVGALTYAGQGVPPPEPPPGVPLWLLILSPGHLWFLWTLLQLYAVVLVARALVGRYAWAERSGVLLGDLLTRPGGVLVPAATYWAGLELSHKIIGGPVTLLPELPSSIAFLGAFLTGWFCWGREEALPRLMRSWPVHLLLALATTSLLVVRGGAEFNMESTVTPWWMRLVVAVAVWAWCYGFLGMFAQLFAAESFAARYVADASYWMYIVHLPLVVLAQFLLLGSPLPWLLKSLVVIVGCTLVLLGSYHLLVRSTWLGKWLNGRKYPWVGWWPRPPHS